MSSTGNRETRRRIRFSCPAPTSSRSMPRSTSGARARKASSSIASPRSAPAAVISPIGFLLLRELGVRADATAPGDDPHRARSSSVFPFATRGRRVELHGLPVDSLRRPSYEGSRRLGLPLSRHSAASRRPRWGPCAHRRRTVPAPLGCGAEPRRRCDPACGIHGHRARMLPTNRTHPVRRRRDRSSWLLQPTLSEAQLQVALDTAQQTGPNVFTRTNCCRIGADPDARDASTVAGYRRGTSGAAEGQAPGSAASERRGAGRPSMAQQTSGRPGVGRPWLRPLKHARRVWTKGMGRDRAHEEASLPCR